MASDHPFVRLENERLVVEIAADFGPRITHFSRPGATNLLAELGDLSINLADGRRYLLRGGHRLWVAPERPELTYEPDDDPVALTDAGSTVTVTKPATSPVNIEKEMQVTLLEDSVHIVHTLTNRGDSIRQIAPWAITQLPPGGTAVLPLPSRPRDDHGLQPNAAVVLWPYSGVADDPFSLENRMVIVDTDRSEPTKLGVALERGWLAYQRKGFVFVKLTTHDPDGRYLDMGASGQVYAGPDFTELETLGEQQKVPPGASIHHAETWRVFEAEAATPPAQLAARIGLD